PPPLLSALSLHDALPISRRRPCENHVCPCSLGDVRIEDDSAGGDAGAGRGSAPEDRRSRPNLFGEPRGEDGGELRGADPVQGRQDRKSTRLNSSHVSISY